MHLGTSYLTLLINEQNALNYDEEKQFDPLIYPYYFNLESELHHIVNDPSTLDLLLKHYEQHDIRILDHLLLLDHKGRTPLHVAKHF